MGPNVVTWHAEKKNRAHSLALGHFGVKVESRGVNKEPEKKMSQGDNRNKLMYVTETKTGEYFPEDRVIGWVRYCWEVH